MCIPFRRFLRVSLLVLVVVGAVVVEGVGGGEACPAGPLPAKL